MAKSGERAIDGLTVVLGLNSMKTLLATVLSFTVFSVSAAVYNSDGTVQNIQAIHNNQAVDGDTIMVPAGTFSWTARLNITNSP